MKVSNLRRPRLGAEELIELGQSNLLAPSVPSSSTFSPSVAPAAAARTIQISRAEGQLLIKVVENIVTFAKDFPIEFTSYCPADRWQSALTQVGTWTQQIESQINAGAKNVSVPADAIFKLVDLEKCISAARDARLASARWAFGISAVAAISGSLLGWKWMSTPAYIAGLAILFGRPLMAKYYPEPQDPYQPSLAGLAGTKHGLGGCAAPHETDVEKAMAKIIERVVVPASPGIKRYYWGEVDCMPVGPEKAVCLKKDRFRVRVEGWSGDIVRPINGWEFSEDCEKALNIIGVWDEGAKRETVFGPIPKESRHEETYWVQYVGPNTDGKIRIAGPFGCPFDTRDYGLEDGGILDRGVDGDLVLLDESMEPVDESGGDEATSDEVKLVTL